MLKTQTHQSNPAQTLVPWYKPFISGMGSPSSPLRLNPSFCRKQKNIRLCHVPSTIKAIVTTAEQSTSVKAVVTVKLTVGGFLSNLGLSHGLDDITDLVGKSILLELVSAELHPKTGVEKERNKGYAHRMSQDGGEVKYECDFVVPEDFGDIGAVLVENEHHKEMYFKKIAFDGFPNGPVNVSRNSWVASKFDNPEKRIFFTNKILSLMWRVSSSFRMKEECVFQKDAVNVLAVKDVVQPAEACITETLEGLISQTIKVTGTHNISIFI